MYVCACVFVCVSVCLPSTGFFYENLDSISNVVCLTLLR